MNSKYKVLKFKSGLSNEIDDQISIEEPQELYVDILDSSWTSDDGLEISFRTILDVGRSRDVSIELIGNSGSNSQLLQSFESFLTPGIRHFSLSLGSPSLSSVSIRLTPIDWISHDSASDEIIVSPPEISGTIEIISISPEIPSAGDIVSIDVLISKNFPVIKAPKLDIIGIKPFKARPVAIPSPFASAMPTS